jgi:hypothetical protein
MGPPRRRYLRALPSDILATAAPICVQAEQNAAQPPMRALAQAKGRVLSLDFARHRFFFGMLKVRRLAGSFDAQARMWAKFAGSAAQKTVFDAGRTRSQVGVAESPPSKQALALYSVRNPERVQGCAGRAGHAAKGAQKSLEAEQLTHRCVCGSFHCNWHKLRYGQTMSRACLIAHCPNVPCSSTLNRVERLRGNCRHR